MSAARWRSGLLGESQTLELARGQLEVFRRGEGPPVVFAHGWLANANLWRKVVDRMAENFTCVTLDLPLGAHRIPLADCDLSPAGCGELIADAIHALDLNEMTLVGNDSGGAYSQIAVSRHPERVARLVLNSCETPYDPFPPPPFDGLPLLARDPRALGEALGALRDRTIRSAPAAFGLLIKHGLDDAVSDSYALPCLEDEAILSDIARVMHSATSEPVHAAGHQLIESFEKPVLFAWSPEDKVFPVTHAQRYAGALRDGRVTLIEDAYSFTPEDQPEQLADAIGKFAGK